MEEPLTKLQGVVRDRSAFEDLQSYSGVCFEFLQYIEMAQPTRIISPTRTNYVFYQYNESHGHKITRPLNTNLFIPSASEFHDAFERFITFLSDLKAYGAPDRGASRKYAESNEINQVVYTMQQSIGSIGDSFENANQSRKIIGQLFETLIKLIIKGVGVECEPRTVNLPIPGFPGYRMPYELDVVFSRNKAILTAETTFIHASEIVGSIKTTSKDRIDKVFLDKYLLTKLLGRDIPVVAVFLHDVQGAGIATRRFAVNSTFKTNHFLGYTVALNKLDGVYYVDPRPEMLTNERLREQIHDFRRFLVEHLWLLAKQ